MDNLPITPEPVSPSPFKTNSKLVPVLLTLFILALISLIAILYYQNQQLKDLLTQKENQPISISPSIPSTPTPGPTDNWKVYTSEKYKVSFQYPKNWIVEDKSIEVTGSGPYKTATYVSLSLLDQNNQSIISLLSPEPEMGTPSVGINPDTAHKLKGNEIIRKKTIHGWYYYEHAFGNICNVHRDDGSVLIENINDGEKGYYCYDSFNEAGLFESVTPGLFPEESVLLNIDKIILSIKAI